MSKIASITIMINRSKPVQIEWSNYTIIKQIPTANRFNPLSIKWMNCLSVFDRFVGLALKGLGLFFAFGCDKRKISEMDETICRRKFVLCCVEKAR